MFGTLLGALPDPPSDLAGVEPSAAAAAARLAAVLAAQEAARLEPLSDATPALDVETAGDAVERWRATAARTQRAVKQVLRGPWSTVLGAGESSGVSSGAKSGRRALERAVLARAEAIGEHVRSLAESGCPLVEIQETEAHRIGADEHARRVFREAHVRLARDVPRTHLSLSIVGGSAWEAGPSAILDPPYHSLAVDLIAGPDNWRLVAVTPTERGIVAGALDVRAGALEGPEVLLWAAHYAASTGGRGLARVGLGTGGSLAHLTWEQATARLRVLGEAVRIIGLPLGERADAIDPRAVSSRAAALGRTRHSERRREPGGEG